MGPSLSPFAPQQLQPQRRTRRARTGSPLGESWAGGEGRTGMSLGQAPWARACPQQEALPAPLSSDSTGPSPSPAPASSPQSSQHQRGWSRPSSHSPRGWLLLPPFLPRPNQPPCWPPSKKDAAVLGCPGPLRCPSAGAMFVAMAGSSLAVPLHTSAVPRPSDPQPSTSADMERGRAGDPGRI